MNMSLANVRAILRLPTEDNRAKAFYHEPHFWIIIFIITCGTILYHADSLPLIDSIESSLRIDFARRSVHRILSILPVAYAAFVFGLRGGLFTTALISALLLPRVFVQSSDPQEAAIEVAAFSFIGAFVSWLIALQNREKAQHRQTIVSLEWTQRELRSHIAAVEQEERRLATMNTVLSVVAESLELPEIIEHSMGRVRDVMGAEKSLLYLLDEDADEIVLYANHGFSEQLVAEKDRMKLGEGYNGNVALSGEPLVVKNSLDSAPGATTTAGEDVQTMLVVPLKAKGKVLGTLCVATGNLREFTDEEIGIAGAIGNVIGVAVENARLYQKERETAERLRQSEESYRGLFENATEAIVVHDLQGAIIAANRAFEKLTGYSRGELEAMNIEELLPTEALNLTRETFLQRLILNQGENEPQELSLKRRRGGEAIIEILSNLILRDDKPVGVQSIVHDITEQRRLQENLRYYVSEILKAQENERLRIARELHDDTAQALTGVSRRLDMLSSEDGVPPEVAERVDQLREQTDNILNSVRRFSQDLRPPVLDDLGLLPALKWLLVNLEEQDGIGANIRIVGEPYRLERDAELALFRIAQEALSNVRKHAQASAVEFLLDYRDGQIRMSVADNGAGFDLPQSRGDVKDTGKLGLIGMQERARLLGGTLEVRSEMGQGTSVTCCVPGSLVEAPQPERPPELPHE